MAFASRSVRVPPNSVNLEEARTRVIALFKKSCRSIPTVIDIYNLDEVVTISSLRSVISSKFRKNSHISNPKVIDLLVFKGTEELNNVVEHAKQRHHIIGEYVTGPQEGLVHDRDLKDQTSEFLKQFYISNYA